MPKTAIVGLVLLLAGVVLLVVALSYNNEYHERRLARLEWPTTQGTVLDSRLQFTEDYEYRTVEFTYQIDGMPHTDQQTWDTKANEPKYSEGAVVTVYYNPKNPDEAYVWPEAFDRLMRTFVDLLFYYASLFFIAGIGGIGIEVYEYVKDRFSQPQAKVRVNRVGRVLSGLFALFSIIVVIGGLTYYAESKLVSLLVVDIISSIVAFCCLLIAFVPEWISSKLRIRLEKGGVFALVFILLIVIDFVAIGLGPELPD